MPEITISQARRLRYPNPNIQTILFDKSITLKDSRDFLKRHGYLFHNYRLTKNQRRFIQNEPIIGARYYSKTIQEIPKITFVFQEY